MRRLLAHPRHAGALLAAGISLSLGLVTLGRKSIWYDESYTFFATRGSWSDLWYLIVDHERPHAIYYGLFKAWTAIAGTSEWAARAPSVVLAAAAALALYYLGVRLLGAAPAVVAAFALATNPFLVVWSQQARSYTLAVTTTLLATIAFVAALRDPSGLRWAVYAVSAIVAVAVHFMVVLVVASHLLAAAVERKRLGLAAAVAAFAAIGAFAAAAAAVVGDRAPQLTAWLTEPTAGDVVKAVVEVAGYSVIPIVAAVLGGVAAWRNLERWQAVLLIGWVTAPFALSYAASFVKPAFSARYLIVAAPAFALLTGVWLTSVRRPIAVAAAAGLVTWSAAVLVFWYQAPPIENWRDATSAALSMRNPGEPIIVAPSTARIGFEYYSGSRVREGPLDGPSVVVVAYGPSAAAQRERAREAVGPAFDVVADRRIDDALRVQRWRRR